MLIMTSYFKKNLLCVVLIALSISLYGQQPSDSIPRETILQMLKYDGITAFGGLKHAYTRPFHWQKDDFITAGAVIAGTVILYSFDAESSRFFMRQEKNAPRILKDFGRYFGAPQNNYMLSAGIYGVGLFTRNEKLRHTGVLLIASATAAGFIQSLSKNIVGRARPETLEGRNSFKPFSSQGAFHSFPSGHSVLSFTTAHAIARQFDSWWVKGGIYTIGMISPISRLSTGAHWLTDVTLGVVLSVVIVDSIDNYLKDNNKYKLKKQRKISWKMNFGAGRIGLIGTF